MAALAQFFAQAIKGKRVDEATIAADSHRAAERARQRHDHIAHEEQQLVELLPNDGHQIPKTAHGGGVEFIEPQFLAQRGDGQWIGSLAKLATAPAIQTELGNALADVSDSTFTCSLDNDDPVKVTITVDHDTRSATIDFAGTARQRTLAFFTLHVGAA